MSKKIQEQIEVMQHFANGGYVEYKKIDSSTWIQTEKPSWNWVVSDYRIKAQEKTITIEKWLCKNGDNSYYTVETNDILGYEKVKLLDSYEVQI